ncbi:MAG: YbaN family protein [Acidobacteriota bacterium]|nr:YbaN family protein [Acidobacteriota bacterium]
MLVRVLFATAGVICLGGGVLGIILPGIPHTPFLLLAAYCFARSSERLHTWLVTHPWFGPYIQGAKQGWRIPRKQALQTIGALWLSMAVSAWVIGRWWAAALLLMTAIGVTIFLERRSRGVANP